MKDPTKTNVHDTFDGSNRYQAPVFQRYYVWGREELDALLDDIENSTDDSCSQFIGATVVQDLGKTAGPQSPNEYLMIDGQQRLTTIYLLLCGIAWCYWTSKQEDKARTIAEMYLAFNARNYLGMPKLIPTVQDRAQLYRILEEEVDCIAWDFSAFQSDDTSKKTRITRQWQNIKKHFRETFYSANNRLLKTKITAFSDNLISHIEFVQITLDTDDDANSVFSKLNFLGIELALADLVRNDVFARYDAAKMKNAMKFYQQEWMPFEKAFPKDSFDQFVYIYALIKFKGNCVKSRAFPKLQKSWARKTPKRILSELSQYADLYCSLAEYEPVPDFHKDVNEGIRRLSLMPKTTVTWPYILQLLMAFRKGQASKKQVISSLLLVESFLVRRAIAGLEPTGLHAVFKGLWQKAGADVGKLKSKIETTTIKCPDNKTVRHALLTDNMYTRQITKYVLVQRERSHNAARKFDNATDDFSVEHVMPRNWSGPWRRVCSKQDHAMFVNRIGNLLPLTKKQNSTVKDASWAVKKKFFKGSNWKVTQKAANRRDWNPDCINRRSRMFVKWAIDEWPELADF